jgi:hypothetical protein
VDPADRDPRGTARRGRLAGRCHDRQDHSIVGGLAAMSAGYLLVRQPLGHEPVKEAAAEVADRGGGGHGGGVPRGTAEDGPGRAGVGYSGTAAFEQPAQRGWRRRPGGVLKGGP